VKKELKPFGDVIQVCPWCGKIDVYKGDGHICDPDYQLQKQDRYDYGDS